MDKLPDEYNDDMAVKQMKCLCILSDFIQGNSEMSLIFGLLGVRDFVSDRRSHLAPKGHYLFIKITYKKTKIFYINKWPLIFLPDRHLSFVCIFL